MIRSTLLCLLLTCVICTFLIPASEGKYFNETVYRDALQRIGNESCYLKTAVSSFCWLCNGSSISRNRYMYKSRCQRAYGSASTVKLLPCPHTRRKNFCYFTCDTKGQKQCCPHSYGPLCLRCPVGVVQHSRFRSFCSGRGTCRTGVPGTGYCACRYRFRGTACQKCRYGYYGSYCQFRCNCVHGYCEGGRNRNCKCVSGWTGTYCSRKIKSCPKACGPNEKCVPPGKCACKIGYEGKNCTEIDLCAPGKNKCAKYSSCSQTYSNTEQRKKAICKCLPGFRGDGYHCILANPCHWNVTCQTNQQCVTVLRNLPVCMCKNNYHKVNGTCVPRKCGKPSLCPTNAICIYDSSYKDEQRCKCKIGYYGNTCIPTIKKVTEELSEKKEFSGKTDIMEAFGRTLERSTSVNKITVLLPLGKMTQEIQRRLRFIVINRHVVMGLVTSAPDAANETTRWTAYGEKIVFRFKDPRNLTGDIGTVFVDNVTISIKSRHNFIAGVAYVIEKVITNKNDKYEIKSRSMDIKSYLNKISKPMTSLFESFIKLRIGANRFKLILFPIKDFTKHEYEYLTSNDTVATYKYKHFLDSMTVLLNSFTHFTPLQYYVRGLRVITPRSWRLSVDADGKWYLSGSRVVANRIMIGNTMIVLVEKPIQSALQYPILPGQCNLKQTHLFKIPWPKHCPTGTYKVNRNRWSKIVICQRDTIMKKQCCPGFFGRTCQFHCPGPYGKPCYNNGKCLDGLKGSGACFCKDGFTGLECEKCISDKMFGPKCNKTCQCVNGKCDSGTIFSSGRCWKCNPGYRGPFCDRKIVLCYNTTLICGPNQHCERNEEIQPQCVCNEGYKKVNSSVCTVHNRCEDPDTKFGGCRENAVCKYLGPGNSTCICKKGYHGDGIVCQRQFGECKTRQDCKTKEAVCIMGKCQCKNGRSYHKGNCAWKFDCQVNNGGCHPYAYCLPVAPDYDSHCKCRQNVPGDGFICLVTWKHDPTMQSGINNIEQKMYIIMYALSLKKRQRKESKRGPFTIIYARQNPRNPLMKMKLFRKIDKMILNGLHFMEGKNAFKTADFFYFNSSMWKLNTTTKGNETYLGDAKVIQSNLYVLEGLLHIVEKFPTDQSSISSVRVLNSTSLKTRTTRMIKTTTTATPTQSGPPKRIGPPKLMYPIDDRGIISCNPPFQKLHVNLTVHVRRMYRHRIFIQRPKWRWYDISMSRDRSRLWITKHFCIVDHTKLPNASYCMQRLASNGWRYQCPTGFAYIKKKFEMTPSLPLSSLLNRVVLSTGYSTNNSYWRDYVSETFNSKTPVEKDSHLCCKMKPGKFHIPTNQTKIAVLRLLRCPLPTSADFFQPPFYSPLWVLFPQFRSLMSTNFLCGYRKRKIMPTTLPPPKEKVSRLAYLVFGNDDCPRNRRFPMNHTGLISRYPVFGIPTQKLNTVHLCTPESPDAWPRGYYCAVKLDRFYSCPKMLGRKLLPSYIGKMYVPGRRFDRRMLHYLCCGKFGSSLVLNRNAYQKKMKSMPAFTLIRMRYCPMVPLYTLSQDRLMFTYKVVLSSILFSSWKPGSYNLHLCHYSDKTVFSYALPKPITGCEKGFLTGFRVQHLEKNNTIMPLRSINLAGSFKLNHNIIRLEFCVNIGKPYRFPPGKYCIYRKMGSCPSGFTSSWAQIDDEDDIGSTGSVGGVVPDGVYASDSKYFFCCRNDGSTNNKIILPFTKPFYLFKSPHSDVCQKVENFTVRHEYLMLDAEDERVLGKPPVQTNGSVPLTRSKIKGVDAVVHYCYYENRLPRERIKHMGVIVSGDRCPSGSRLAPNYFLCPEFNCTKRRFHTCFFNETFTGSLWPKGRYCLVKSGTEQCFEGFYKTPIRAVVSHRTLIDTMKVPLICCRDTLDYVGSLSLPFLEDFSFGIIAPICNNIKNVKFNYKIRYSLFYYICYYVPLWPNTVDYALPKIGRKCPPNFQSTTIGQLYLKNSVLMNVFSQKDSTKDLRRITALEVCSKIVRKKSNSDKSTTLEPRRPWPAGHYCIFSSDENVVNEFANIVSYSKAVENKGWMSVNFIFCREDGQRKLPNGLPIEYMAIPALSSCPTYSSSQVIKLDDFTRRDGKIHISESRWFGEDGVKSHPSFIKDRGALQACIYKNSSGIAATRYTTMSSFKNSTCKCQHEYASCDDNNICRCNRRFVGDGIQCLPCACNQFATCSAGNTLWTSSCQCPTGHSGNGLFCKHDPYAMGVTVPDTKQSDWPRGIFSFLKTYDNIQKCPSAFTIQKSRLVGRTERVLFFTEMESVFCTRSSDNGKENWPNGHYCVWGHGSSCPSGLKSVELFLPFRFHRVSENDTFVKETILDHTRLPAIRFCCKSTNNQDQEIVFPPSTYFSLLRKKSKCPKIKSMTAVEQQFYLATGSKEPLFRLINGTAKRITATPNYDGPDIKWDSTKNSTMIRLCNYYISRKEIFPTICHPSGTQICQPKMDLYSVLTSNSSQPQVHEMRYVLDYCELMEKVNEVYHIHITFFLDLNLLATMHHHLEKKKGTKNPVCESVKRAVVLTDLPMSVILAKMAPGETKRFKSFGSTTPVLTRLNSSEAYTFDNVTIDTIPLLAARNGMIFRLQGSLAVMTLEHQGRSSSASHIHLVVGIILTIVFAAGLIALAVFYIKKRNMTLSMSGFVNPVYYRHVEE